MTDPSLSYSRMFMQIFYPAMAAAGAATPVKPLPTGEPKFFGRSFLAKGLHGRGGSRCRHCWIKYFHKHARITERRICHLDEDYFHDKPAKTQLLIVNCSKAQILRKIGLNFYILNHFSVSIILADSHSYIEQSFKH